nr:MAG TPA: hypothetical protein [Caudoviricetes sp.]
MAVKTSASWRSLTVCRRARSEQSSLPEWAVNDVPQAKNRAFISPLLGGRLVSNVDLLRVENGD